MCDQGLRWQIEQAVEEIKELRKISPPLPEDWELALELGTDGETGEPICSYYFVCLSTRCLFWLHEVDLDSVLLNLCGVTEKTHICKSTPAPGIHKTKFMVRPGIASTVLVGGYRKFTLVLWLTTPRYHWEMFPHNREVPEPVIQELTGILLYARIGTSEPVLGVV